jgi:lysosomal Pro-X carboxypeptidase
MRLVLLVLLLPLAAAAMRHAFGARARFPAPKPLASPKPWVTEWFTQRLDHFNAADGRTFPQRCLISRAHLRPHGPILMYTGNEGDIESFADNSGFLFVQPPPPC